MSHNFEEKYRKIENNTYTSDIKSQAEGFKKGAIIGGITGIASAFLFKGRFFIWTAIGIIGGGYIGYKMMETKNKEAFQNLNQNEN